MRRSRKVKILATIGPASSSEEMLKKLFEAGADVFRINMSHTDHELMRTLVGRIRSYAQAAVAGVEDYELGGADARRRNHAYVRGGGTGGVSRIRSA